MTSNQNASPFNKRQITLPGGLKWTSIPVSVHHKQKIYTLNIEFVNPDKVQHEQFEKHADEVTHSREN